MAIHRFTKYAHRAAFVGAIQLALIAGTSVVTGHAAVDPLTTWCDLYLGQSKGKSWPQWELRTVTRPIRSSPRCSSCMTGRRLPNLDGDHRAVLCGGLTPVSVPVQVWGHPFCEARVFHCG